MSDDARSPAQYAADIEAAMERLVAFAAGCSPEQWRAAPLGGDPRPGGGIVDPLAGAHDYMGGWGRGGLARRARGPGGARGGGGNPQPPPPARGLAPRGALQP